MAFDIYKYDKLPDKVKRHIIAVWFELLNKFPAFDRGKSDNFFAVVAKELWVKYDEFQSPRNSGSPSESVCNFFGEQQDVKKCLEIMELVFSCLSHFYRADVYVNAGLDYDIYRAKAKLNAVFQEHSVGYEFRGDKIFRIDSGVMHKEVVAPTMTLLYEPFFKGANEEFLKAHEHFRQGTQQIQISEEIAAFVIHSTGANILFLASLEKRLK